MEKTPISENLEAKVAQLTQIVSALQLKVETLEAAQAAGGARCIKLLRPTHQILQSGITLHNEFPTWNYSLVAPDNARILILQVYYIHSAINTSHGYLNFEARRSGDTYNKVIYDSAHFNTYFNSDIVELMAPWTRDLSQVLEIKVTNSDNTVPSDNPPGYGRCHYDIKFTGWIVQ